jgi:hypothetical protein
MLTSPPASLPLCPVVACSLRSQETCPSKCRDGSEMVRIRASSAYAAGMPGDVVSFQKEILQYGPVETGM